MKQDQQINELLAVFASAMIAVSARLMSAVERPSKAIAVSEILVGLGFCFFLAPALQEHYKLSVKETCGIVWVSSYFSGLILKAGEDAIKSYSSIMLKLGGETIKAYFSSLKSWAKTIKRKDGDDDK